MSDTNTSVTRALEVLDLLGRAAPDALRLTDIAHRLDLPQSTTHRLLTSLAKRGYVRQRRRTGPYSLGWKIVLLAQSLDVESQLMQEAHPFLEELVHRVGQAVNLGVLSDREVLYLDCLVPNVAMSLYVPPGTTVPAYATALGKALFAFLPEVELEAILPRLAFEPLTSRTAASISDFQSALEEVRQQGYAVDRGELKRDVNCLAVPIRNPGGHAVAAISVTARVEELSANWVEENAPLVLATAEKITSHLEPFLQSQLRKA